MSRIVVAGAGIGGLTTALALAKAGRSVTVLERHTAPAEYGAGLQLSPNATRVLRDLDLLDSVSEVSLEPQAVRVRRGRDAADLIRFPLGSHAAARYGAPFLLTLRPDLHRILADRVTAAAEITVRYGCAILGHETRGSRVAIDTDQGLVEADGFIDGRGVGVSFPQASGRLAWRALVPIPRSGDSGMRPETNLWLGPRAHLVHYPVPGRGCVNVVAITDADDRGLEPGDLWSRPGNPDHMRQAFSGWHDDALRLLEPTAEWRCWPLLQAPTRPFWSRGAATVIGDAAHPMMPFLAQGASQAIEDAGALHAALRQTSDVPAAFAAYERQRRPRAERVQAASKQQGAVYHLRRPASDARDFAMRLIGGERALTRLDWLYAG